MTAYRDKDISSLCRCAIMRAVIVIVFIFYYTYWVEIVFWIDVILVVVPGFCVFWGHIQGICYTHMVLPEKLCRKHSESLALKPPFKRFRIIFWINISLSILLVHVFFSQSTNHEFISYFAEIRYIGLRFDRETNFAKNGLSRVIYTITCGIARKETAGSAWVEYSTVYYARL